MNIDEGAYLVLSAAKGAFSTRLPPFPREWNPIDRPYVAHLIPTSDEIFRVFLSNPTSPSSVCNLDLSMNRIEGLPVKSLVEVKHDSIDYSYYRRDNGMWTKVGEAQYPFLIEVYSRGSDPIIMTATNIE
ncbi:MAG: hypothetical protein JSW61_09330 [Candidatus Thorarchaeota archaeon]|nr:MAG: hypothetical protein JSW61_09330 [Candidatus Thorarchaeota archaeon]